MELTEIICNIGAYATIICAAIATPYFFSYLLDADRINNAVERHGICLDLLEAEESIDTNKKNIMDTIESLEKMRIRTPSAKKYRRDVIEALEYQINTGIYHETPVDETIRTEENI